jgi:hypothetical protein
MKNLTDRKLVATFVEHLNSPHSPTKVGGVLRPGSSTSTFQYSGKKTSSAKKKASMHFDAV